MTRRKNVFGVHRGCEMGRRCRVSLAVALFLCSGELEIRGGAQGAQTLTFEGDTAYWAVAIRPDKTADFEAVIAKLRDGLMKSDKPERRQQAAGWKIIRLSKPMPDGNITYVHMVSPVVRGADYTVMQVLYDEFPEERQALYDLYRGAFANSLAMAAGNVVVDMTKSSEAAHGTETGVGAPIADAH